MSKVPEVNELLNTLYDSGVGEVNQALIDAASWYELPFLDLKPISGSSVSINPVTYDVFTCSKMLVVRLSNV